MKISGETIKTKKQFIELFKKYGSTIGYEFKGENPFQYAFKNFKIESWLLNFCKTTFEDFEGDLVDIFEWFDELEPVTEECFIPSVDFEMLKDSFRHQEASSIKHVISALSQEELQNLELFIKLISDSEEFAIVAHKELNKSV